MNRLWSLCLQSGLLSVWHKHGCLPDNQEWVTQTVLAQAELITKTGPADIGRSLLTLVKIRGHNYKERASNVHVPDR